MDQFIITRRHICEKFLNRKCDNIPAKADEIAQYLRSVDSPQPQVSIVDFIKNWNKRWIKFHRSLSVLQRQSKEWLDQPFLMAVCKTEQISTKRNKVFRDLSESQKRRRTIDPFLPRPDNLLVNLKECRELVKDLLTQFPKRFADTHDPGSALGAALQVAYKLMQASGGRVTVFQTCLPNKGSLEPREDPNNRSAKDIAHLNPATDFYKRYALDSSGYQIAVDLFLLNQQYSDLATISGVSKHSDGCVHHFPLYQKTKPQHIESLKQCFKRYLTRKIGFEAVMRIRCTRGLQVHTFHGNFFVRSTDICRSAFMIQLSSDAEHYNFKCRFHKRIKMKFE